MCFKITNVTLTASDDQYSHMRIIMAQAENPSCFLKLIQNKCIKCYFYIRKIKRYGGTWLQDFTIYPCTVL